MNNTTCSKLELKNPYPSMADIEAEVLLIKPETEQALRNWKEKYFKDWRILGRRIQLYALTILIEYIWMSEHKSNDYTYQIVLTDHYAWCPDPKAFFLNEDHPSIISTLHELGHSVHGSSELLACRYSIQLFKTVFPKSFAKLKTEGHMLKQ